MAAALALLPLLMASLAVLNDEPTGAMALNGIDDAEGRGAAALLLAAPFIYLAAVPVCYGSGALLLRLNLRTFASFLGAAMAIAALLGFGIGMLLAIRSHSVFPELAAPMAVSCSLLLMAAIPTALCFWFLVGRAPKGSQ